MSGDAVVAMEEESKQAMRKKLVAEVEKKCWRWGMSAGKGRMAVDALKKCEQEDGV